MCDGNAVLNVYYDCEYDIVPGGIPPLLSLTTTDE